MLMEFKNVFIKNIYIAQDKEVGGDWIDKKTGQNKVYATMESSFAGGMGELRVTILGVNLQELEVLAFAKLPYTITADVKFRIFGSGVEATNIVELHNMHVADPFGMLELARQEMAHFASNGKPAVTNGNPTQQKKPASPSEQK